MGIYISKSHICFKNPHLLLVHLRINTTRSDPTHARDCPADNGWIKVLFSNTGFSCLHWNLWTMVVAPEHWFYHSVQTSVNDSFRIQFVFHISLRTTWDETRPGKHTTSVKLLWMSATSAKLSTIQRNASPRLMVNFSQELYFKTDICLHKKTVYTREKKKKMKIERPEQTYC